LAEESRETGLKDFSFVKKANTTQRSPLAGAVAAETAASVVPLTTPKSNGSDKMLAEKEARIRELEGKLRVSERQCDSYQQQIERLGRKDSQPDMQRLESANKKLREDLYQRDSIIEELEERQQLASQNNGTQLASATLIFPEEDILRATNGFADSAKIGQVPSGDLYCAQWGGWRVTVKRLTTEVAKAAQRQKAEIDNAFRYRHPKFVTLLGHTDLLGTRPCLVYEFMPQGSLGDRLRCLEGSPPLPWETRLRIAWEIACALNYLHLAHSKADAVAHLDVTSDTILLTNQFEAKLADLGLVRSSLHATTGSCSQGLLTPSSKNPGYICPDYLQTGRSSQQTDVYAFGVVLAELLTGKPALVAQQSGGTTHLASLLRESLQFPSGDTAVTELVDPLVAETWPADRAQALAALARHCVELDPVSRPAMLEVVWRLQVLVDGDYKTCLACNSNTASVLLQCHHQPLCADCVPLLRRKGEGCPSCRVPLVEKGK